MDEQSNFDKYAGSIVGALILWMLIALYPATTIGSYVGHVTGDDAYGVTAFVFAAVILLVIKIILTSIDSDELSSEGFFFCFVLWLIYAGAHLICFVPFMQICWWAMSDSPSGTVPFPDLHWFIFF